MEVSPPLKMSLGDSSSGSHCTAEGYLETVQDGVLPKTFLGRLRGIVEFSYKTYFTG